ncbi:MAG: hypothetical protein JNL01_08420 [Bdellovibrionales bacterium]|nr:hypothetical protein [Bdellovibrionales bacterium]
MKRIFFASISAAVGLVFAAFLFFAAEVFFRLNETHRWIPRVPPVLRPAAGGYDAGTIDFSEIRQAPQDFGDGHIPSDVHEPNRLDFSECPKNISPKFDYWFGGPGCVVKAHLRKQAPSRRIIYEQVYHFEEDGSRLTPDQDRNAKDALIFMGCSFTFGDGVKDSEVFSNQLVRIFRDQGHSFRVLNLGTPGWGISQTVRLLRVPQDIRLKNLHGRGRDSIAVYNLIDDHFLRLVGSAEFLSRFKVHAGWPYFEMKGSTPQDLGSFSSGRPFLTWFYGLIGNSALFKHFGVDLPLIGAREIQLMKAMILDLRSSIRNHYGIDHFVLSVFPGSTRWSVPLAEQLRQEGVAVFDFSGLPINEKETPGFFIPGDGHPSAAGHRLYARLLHREITKKFPLVKSGAVR